MNIKLLLTFSMAFLWLNFSAIAQESEEESTVKDCKDYPMISRMTKFDLSDCIKNYKNFEVIIGNDQSKNIEGTNMFYRYAFADENSQGPSWFQLFKNYENAVKKIGGTTLYNDGDATANFYLKKDRFEIYLNLYLSGGNADDISEYLLTVIEVEAMKQEVTATDIFKNLEKDGFMTVDIQFETGKSTIKAESFPIIEAIVEMMKNNNTLSLSVEGHTDNVGDATSNLTLSQNRAQAVTNAIVSKGIDKSRLSSKGFGASNPLADNRTEEGRAKNRRVELVKK
jgi:outer membrane protein OmpA-like peptidoglycan-associated protein